MRTLAETTKTSYDAEGNKVTSTTCEHKGDYEELLIEKDAFDVLLGIHSLKTLRVLIYLLHYANPGTGIINFGSKSFAEIEKELGITRQSFLYTLTKLVKLGLLHKVTNAVHVYSGFPEPGIMHYIFNFDMIMKPYEGVVSDMYLDHKLAHDPNGKLLSSSLVVRIDD